MLVLTAIHEVPVPFLPSQSRFSLADLAAAQRALFPDVAVQGSLPVWQSMPWQLLPGLSSSRTGTAEPSGLWLSTPAYTV